MNFIICGSIAIIFFALGWVVGVKNLSHIESLTDKLEQATEQIEKIEPNDIDNASILINDNRDANAQFHIQILKNIEDGDLETAQENLINDIAQNYDDIKEDKLHGIHTEQSQKISKEIETLAKKHPSFKKVIEFSEVD